MTTRTDPTSRGSAAEVAQRFLHALETMDIRGTQLLRRRRDPGDALAPPGIPNRLEGIDALRRQYGGLPDAYQSTHFDIRSVRPLADPEWVLLTESGERAAPG